MAQISLISKMNIKVYPDFTKENSCKDYSNQIAMKVLPLWQKDFVFIKVGEHTYDDKILTWKSVKVLLEKKIVTITVTPEEINKIVETREKPTRKRTPKAEGKEETESSLSDLAE